MDQRDNGVTVTVTAGNGGAAASPGAVMLVERGDGAAFLARLWPLVLALGVHGLAGEREAVRQTLVRLRGAVGERVGGLGVDRTAEVIGGIDAAIDGYRRAVEEAAERTERDTVRRPARVDVVASMHRAGVLGDAEMAAALELRTVQAELGRSFGLRAVDPGRPVVDGGPAPWCLPADVAGVVLSEALRRTILWAEYVRTNGAPIQGKRGTLTVLELVRSVVVDNEPVSAIDRRLGIKKGTASMQLLAVLALYANLASSGN